MKLSWDETAWKDYNSFIATNIKLVKKINDIIKSMLRTPFEGLGKPERLKHEFKGCFSRRIDDKNRLVYKIVGDTIFILLCGSHYKDK